MSIGGAVVGGARLAMATRFDPDTYWQEVRRYGVTVASYTWTMLHDLVAAPPQPGERHHPVRLWIGSGMPRGLWRRVQRRFAPARVLEFYASTETGAILVNVRDAKPGAMGRPLPGSPEVALAAYDLDADQLVLGADGFVKRAPDGEPGMLLARSRETTGTSMIALRGVFARGDAWLATGDLFRRDADGDYFRLDNVREIIRTPAGPVFTAPIRDALGDLPAVDIAVAYGITDAKGREVPVAAVTVRARSRAVGRRPRRCAVGAGTRAAPRGGARRGRDPGHDLVPADHRVAARRRASPRRPRRARPTPAAPRPTATSR